MSNSEQKTLILCYNFLSFVMLYFSHSIYGPFQPTGGSLVLLKPAKSGQKTMPALTEWY